MCLFFIVFSSGPRVFAGVFRPVRGGSRFLGIFSCIIMGLLKGDISRFNRREWIENRLMRSNRRGGAGQRRNLRYLRCVYPGRGLMVLRIATRGANAGGQFWGCSAYPKCRGIGGLRLRFHDDSATDSTAMLC